MNKFIGRRDFIEDLESLWRKRTSSLVACRGRRRIGKSTLFREFSRRTAEQYIEIEGHPPGGSDPSEEGGTLAYSSPSTSCG